MLSSENFHLSMSVCKFHGCNFSSNGKVSKPEVLLGPLGPWNSKVYQQAHFLPLLSHCRQIVLMNVHEVACCLAILDLFRVDVRLIWTKSYSIFANQILYLHKNSPLLNSLCKKNLNMAAIYVVKYSFTNGQFKIDCMCYVCTTTEYHRYKKKVTS